MKTITYNGIKYKVAFVSHEVSFVQGQAARVTPIEVIVNLPERLIVGHQSRMPIPVSCFSKRIQKLIEKDLTAQR